MKPHCTIVAGKNCYAMVMVTRPPPMTSMGMAILRSLTLVMEWQVSIESLRYWILVTTLSNIYLLLTIQKPLRRRKIGARLKRVRAFLVVDASIAGGV